MTFSERLHSIYAKYFPYWAWLCVTLILGAGGVFIIYPLWMRIQATGAFQYNEISTTQAARQAELDGLKLMSEHLHSINQSQLLYLEDTLPSDLTPAALMEQVASAFATQGLQVGSIDVVDSTATTAGAAASGKAVTVDNTTTALPGIRQLQLTVNSTGDTTYEGMKKFLQAVATSNPILELYSMAYSNERKSYSLVFTTYVAE